MGDPKTIQLLWQYMVHADAQVLAATESLTDEGYAREQGISAGSVHKLIVHCMGAQRTWLERLKGAGTPPLILPESVRRTDVSAQWTALHAELLEFAAAQTPASLAANIRSVTRSGVAFELPVGLCMLHVSDHATYHRGQLNSMIKRAGGTPSGVMVYTYGVREGFGREK